MKLVQKRRDDGTALEQPSGTAGTTTGGSVVAITEQTVSIGPGGTGRARLGFPAGPDHTFSFVAAKADGSGLRSLGSGVIGLSDRVTHFEIAEALAADEYVYRVTAAVASTKVEVYRAELVATPPVLLTAQTAGQSSVTGTLLWATRTVSTRVGIRAGRTAFQRPRHSA